MIKLVFLDIDGTVYSHRTKTVPESTVYAIKELQKKGIKCVSCTGRCLHEMRELHLEHIPFSGHVSLTGQLCFDGNFNLIYSNPIALEDMEKVSVLFEEKRIPIIMYDWKSWYVNMINKDLIDGQNDISTPIPPLREYRGEPIYQFSIYGQRDFAVKWLSGLEHSKISLWNDYAVDVISSDGGKVTGMKAMMKHFNIARSEIMAIGDSNNDIEMMDFAEISVCMGNGEQQTREHADFITSDIDDDGVYKALRHYGLIED